tara:strand:- start:98 stop:418 length:321 start_codon:yes stop_codon:yes gene_type:complete
MLKTFRKNRSDRKKFESLFRNYQFAKSHFSELEETEAHPQLIKKWQEDRLLPSLRKVLDHVYRNILDAPELAHYDDGHLFFIHLVMSELEEADTSRKALKFLTQDH